MTQKTLPNRLAQRVVAVAATALLLSACSPSNKSSTDDTARLDRLETRLAALEAGESNAGAAQASAQDDGQLFFEISSDGKLQQPEGYREWVYVGTPLTPNDLNPPEASFPEFHNVYIDPVSWDIYKESGKFRDGTILVKELVSVGTKNAVSGNGYFMGDYLGLEATIKSSTYFPDEPGNWAYFSFGHSYPLAKTAEAFPANACNACHEASAADDFVFTQHYPVLRARSASVVAANAPDVMHPTARGELQEAMLQSTERLGDARAPTAPGVGPISTDLDALFAYLQSGEYRSFPVSDAEPHRSAGPHLKFGHPVRTYFSEELSASLAEGREVHPAGSTAIKELYATDGETLVGWAVSTKTQADSDGGKGWFWVEFTSTTDPTQIAANGAAGNGITLCSSCHTTGSDYVLSPFPGK